MTSTRPDTGITAADRAQTFVDWTRINAKALTVGAVIVVVAAGAYWFYMRSQQITTMNAEKALATAKQSMTAGNLALAQSDLKNVYAKYASTSPGVEAAMLLAQIDYDAGKYQDGITILQKASGGSGTAGVEATILSLEGDGYTQMNKASEGAKLYEQAAAATTYETENAFQRAKAARAFTVAGDTAQARRVWTSLLNDPKGQSMAAEARVRLGELTVQVAKK